VLLAMEQERKKSNVESECASLKTFQEAIFMRFDMLIEFYFLFIDSFFDIKYTKL
jgi:hypothetical protein